MTKATTTSQSALCPLGLAAALAVFGLLLLLSHPAGPAHREPSGPHAEPLTPRAPLAPRTPRPGRSPSSATGPGAASGIPVPGDGAAGDRAVQRLLERSSPTDLPRGEEQRLVHLATEVWTADVTGRGRGRWPGYFLSPRAAGSHASYQQVRVQAGIARKAGGGRVQVQLVWAGTGPAGDQRDGRLARLLFRILSHRWEPVR